ncbi:MAG TPA: dihydroneopterin aldolase [Flavisolibacter sp.]
MSSFTIQLHHLRFFASHGVYKEETAVGNEFEINLSMEVKAPKEMIRSIDETINYAEVHRIIREIFSTRQQLLETLTMMIADETKKQFPALKKITVQISKLHPPIASFTGHVSVTYTKKFGTK